MTKVSNVAPVVSAGVADSGCKLFTVSTADSAEYVSGAALFVARRVSDGFLEHLHWSRFSTGRTVPTIKGFASSIDNSIAEAYSSAYASPYLCAVGCFLKRVRIWQCRN